MIAPALRSILATAPFVMMLAQDRVYLGAGPQNERRARIVLTLVSASHAHTLAEHAGYVTGTMQVDCLAPTYRDARDLATKVITALDGYCGTPIGTATKIDWLTVENESDIPAQPLEGAATAPTFGVSLDVSFMHQR